MKLSRCYLRLKNNPMVNSIHLKKSNNKISDLNSKTEKPQPDISTVLEKENSNLIKMKTHIDDSIKNLIIQCAELVPEK